MHPIFLVKGSNLWKESKRLLVYCSCSFTIFQTLSSPPSGQDGRTSMLLEERARGVFTRMLWCTKKDWCFFRHLKSILGPERKRARSGAWRGGIDLWSRWPWAKVCRYGNTLNKAIIYIWIVAWWSVFYSWEVGPREPGAAHDDDDDVFRYIVQ